MKKFKLLASMLLLSTLLGAQLVYASYVSCPDFSGKNFRVGLIDTKEGLWVNYSAKDASGKTLPYKSTVAVQSQMYYNWHIGGLDHSGWTHGIHCIGIVRDTLFKPITVSFFQPTNPTIKYDCTRNPAKAGFNCQ